MCTCVIIPFLRRRTHNTIVHSFIHSLTISNNKQPVSQNYRILGGIAVVLPWWPIKAYRPCPNFIKNGGRYVRSGQGLDEIAFGRDSSFTGSGK